MEPEAGCGNQPRLQVVLRPDEGDLVSLVGQHPSERQSRIHVPGGPTGSDDEPHRSALRPVSGRDLLVGFRPALPIDTSTPAATRDTTSEDPP